MTNISQEQNKLGDKSAAALAFATMLSEQLMPKKTSEETGEEMMPEDDEVVLEDETEMPEDVMEDHMVEMEKKIDEKLESFKEEILEAIKNEKESDK